MARKLFLIEIIAILLVIGCVPSPIPKNVMNQYDTKYYPHHYEQRQKEGSPSLWVDNRASGNYFVDNKARFVNDIITIRIAENTSAIQKADTSTSRDNSMSMGISSLFGIEKSGFPGLNSNIDPASLIASENKNKFSGSGSTSRSGSLTSTLTVKVVDVLPNGNLVVAGKKAVKINEEYQTVTITGLVNPVYIEKNNEISSDKVADLRVEFNGVGVMAEVQKPGWLNRLVNFIWPF